MISSRNDNRLLQHLCFSILILLSGNSVHAIEDVEPVIHANNFQLKQKDSEQCFVVLDEMDGCLSNENGKVSACYDSNRVVLDNCDEGRSEQRWVFDFLSKRVHSLERRAELCLTRLSEKLSMESCQSGSLKQLWFFNQQDEFSSRADFPDHLAFVKLLNKEGDVVSPVVFQFVDSATDDNQCYLSPFTGRVECPEFGYHEEAMKQQAVEFWNWSGVWPWQPKQIKRTEDLQLGDSNNNRCLAIEQCHVDSVGQYDCFGGARVQVQGCKLSSAETWRYDLVSKRLFNKQAGEQFCLSWQSGKMTLEHCLPGGAVSQRWYFARGEGREYSEKGRLRWFSNEREHYEFINSLDFDLIVKFEILKKDGQGRECGFDPVDGLWKGLCFN